MNIYKARILKKEFPFLDKLFLNFRGQTKVGPEDVDGIKILRGDKALLRKKGYEDSYSWMNGNRHDFTKYFAICGQNIFELKGAGKAGSGNNHIQDTEWDAPTISEQLIEEKMDPDYIIECVQNDPDGNGNGELTRFWTIFKMKNFDLVDYHIDRIEKAANALKKEITAVCCKK